MYMESNSCAETRTIESGGWMVSLCKPMKRPLSVNILYTCKYPKHLELIAQICVNHMGGADQPEMKGILGMPLHI